MKTTSWASTPAIRRSMQANKSRDTQPELALRSAIHRRGLRFRKHYRPVTGTRITVDIAFPARKIAVFMDGCFWHGCAAHGESPKANAGFWRAKLETNRVRDIRTDEALLAAGWRVVRIWEHEDTDTAAEAIAELIRSVP